MSHEIYDNQADWSLWQKIFFCSQFFYFCYHRHHQRSLFWTILQESSNQFEVETFITEVVKFHDYPKLIV